jgi:acetyl esterase/lipase
MMMIKGLLLVALVASASTPVDMRQYFKDARQPEWYIPVEQGPLIGTQNHWFATPHDILPGKLVLRGKVADVAKRSFEITPNSVWGAYKYRVLCQSGASDSARKAPARSSSRLRDISISELNAAAGRTLVVQAQVKNILPSRKGFDATVQFAEGPVDCRFNVADVAKERRLPEILSRHYGPHWQHTFDLYYPPVRTTGPLPLIMFIHGGGWNGLDKSAIHKSVDGLNELGFAVAAINYRYVSNSTEYPAVSPPVAAPMLDSARALQFIRHHARDFGIDAQRICLTGGSAGGTTALWLALHDDLADAESRDPIARQSTRVNCVVATEAQTTLDPLQMRAWVPGIDYRVQAFFLHGEGPEVFEYVLAQRERIRPWIKAFSPYELVTSDDPPVFLNYAARPNTLPPVDHGHAVHHPAFGKRLDTRLREHGVESHFVAKDVQVDDPRYRRGGARAFLIDKLRRGSTP